MHHCVHVVIIIIIVIDVVSHHNRLRDLVLEFCRRAHQAVRVEKGNGLTPDHSRTRPADILALDWDRGRHAAFDVAVTSPLSVSILPEANMSVGAAALEAEVQKHRANDPKCSELDSL